MEAGGTAAGSSRAVRLDPFSLPVRFEAADEAADERRRVVDLFRERVVVRRCVGGMRMRSICRSRLSAVSPSG